MYVMIEINVMFLGMKNDIMTPLLMVPDFTTLYAIDTSNRCGCSDLIVWEEQWEYHKRDIKQILTDGSDEFSMLRRRWIKYTEKCLENYNKLVEENDPDKDDVWFLDNLKNVDLEEIHYLKSKATILHEFESDIVWILKFMYDGKERELVYYHHANYLNYWPTRIENVSHLFVINALRISQIDNPHFKTLRKMIKERTIAPLTVYADGKHPDHHDFGEILTVKNGWWRNGTKIAKHTLTTEELLPWVTD